MPTPANIAGQPESNIWTILRFVLGMIQMAGATATIIFLFYTGVSTWSLASTVITCALTTLSVLLFGSGRQST